MLLQFTMCHCNHSITWVLRCLEQAFVAVIYLRSVYVNGTVEVASLKHEFPPLLGTIRCCYPESPHEKCDFLFVKTNIHFLLDRLYGNTVLDTNYQALKAICLRYVVCLTENNGSIALEV